MNITLHRTCRMLIIVTAVIGGTCGPAQSSQSSPADCRASYYSREIGELARTCTDALGDGIASRSSSTQSSNTNQRIAGCSGSYYSFEVGELPRNCAVGAMTVRSTEPTSPVQATNPPKTACRGSYYSFEIGELPRNCGANG